MKKIFCLLLALSLLCAGVALADTEITTDGGTGSTTVTYTVPEPGTGYTVVIPASVAIPQGETSTTMQISVGADSTLESGKTLSVKLESSANGFKLQLAEGSETISYKVEKDSQAVNAGDAVLSWKGGEAIPAAATLTMELTESTDGKTAGDYSDTLTFKLSLSVTGFTADHEGFEDGGEVDW